MGEGPEDAAAAPVTERCLAFGPALFNERTRELSVDGQPVAIDRKPLAVLMHLLRQPGRMVSKEELANACWPGRVVSDSALARTVSRLREVLADSEQQLIKTAHGQGYRLVAPVTVAAMPSARPRRGAPLEPGRRQLSLLFCELPPGSEARAAAEAMVQRYEGRLSETVGNGLAICFGHPRAHEDDAERAVRCACDLLRALRRLPGDAQGRAGVHTATVDLGDAVALGLVTSLALRLADGAAPGSVRISPACFRLVRGQFITRETPPLCLPGVDKPLPAYEVLQPSGVRSRLEAAARLTPRVGRDEELRLLGDRWERAREGQGQVCLITAEPGMGKSRLLLCLREQIADSGHTWLECRCSALTRNSAYAPVVELLQRALGIREADDEATRLLRLEQGLDANGLDRAASVPLIAPLLGLAVSAPYAPAADGPEPRRRRTLDLLAGWLLALAHKQPALFVIEDLHWADPSTLDLVARLVERSPRAPLLLLLSSRPEYRPPWPWQGHVSQLTLPPLRRAEAARMLHSLATGQQLDAGAEQGLLERANGVPLFIEELMEARLESELAGGDGAAAVPASLQDSLAARIDNLGEARTLLQLCAVIGREVPHALLLQLAEGEAAMIEEDLQLLAAAQMLHARGLPPQLSYLFKHALIQDSAYNSLAPERRRQLHRRIAETLERGFAEQARREPSVVAEHYEKAGCIAEAVRGYRLAAEHAAARSAARETVAYARHALALLLTLPQDAARDRQELDLLLTAVKWLNYQAGYAHPDIQALLQRARTLAEALGDAAALLAVLSHQYTSHHFAARLEPAVRYGRDITELGRRGKQLIVECTGHSAVGASSYLLGEFERARDEARITVTRCELSIAKPWAQAVGFDPAVTAHLVLTYSQWALGYPDQALAAARDCQARAQAIGLPLVRCVAEGFALPVVHRYRREPAALAATGAAALAYCEQYGYEDGRARALKSIAAGLCLEGQRERGLALLRQVMDQQRRVGALAAFTWDCATVAEFCIAEGRHGEAREALDEAFALVAGQRERFWEPELHRLQGDWLQATGAGAAAAEQSYRQALAVAAELKARALELRAATSLARLLQGSGQAAAAAALLAPVFGAFSEGFDTPDLVEARTLLGRLG